MSDLGRHPEDRFSRNEAHLVFTKNTSFLMNIFTNLVHFVGRSDRLCDGGELPYSRLVGINTHS